MVSPCPGCGMPPRGVPLSCDDCYDPNDDSTELEGLRGHSDTEWNERVQDWLDGRTSSDLRRRVASCDALVDAGIHHSRLRALSRLLRDELTRRHQECRDTWPPPPSVPREERETARP
jgi:hypothetical protein